jgi:hypothetical protein
VWDTIPIGIEPCSIKFVVFLVVGKCLIEHFGNLVLYLFGGDFSFLAFGSIIDSYQNALIFGIPT